MKNSFFLFLFALLAVSQVWGQANRQEVIVRGQELLRLLDQTNTSLSHNDNHSGCDLNISSKDSLSSELGEAVSDQKARERILDANIPEIPLLRALNFFNRMKKQYNINQNYLTVADVTRPSDQDRLWLINMKTGEIEKYKTSHGVGNGAYVNQRTCASYFSHVPNTDLTSGGGYITGTDYNKIGLHWVYLFGMETNSTAYDRGIRFHSSTAVSRDEAGFSHGCLTVSPDFEKKYISRVKSTNNNRTGTTMYIYPNEKDLRDGTYWDPTCADVLLRQGLAPEYREDAP